MDAFLSRRLKIPTTCTSESASWLPPPIGDPGTALSHVETLRVPISINEAGAASGGHAARTGRHQGLALLPRWPPWPDLSCHRHRSAGFGTRFKRSAPAMTPGTRQPSWRCSTRWSSSMPTDGNSLAAGWRSRSGWGRPSELAARAAGPSAAWLRDRPGRPAEALAATRKG